MKKGLAIGAGQNEGFADTWKWVVDFCKNLRGDNTFIRIENGLGDQPTIEWIGNLVVGGQMSGGGGYPKPFDFQYKEITTTSTDPDTGEEVETTTNEPYIVNCVWFFGREHKTITHNNVSTTDFPIDPAAFPSPSGATMWLKIKYDQSSPSIIQPLTAEIVYGVLSSISTLTYPIDISGTTPVQGNTDTITYFPIWNLVKNTDQTTQETTVTPVFDWRPAWKTPFYSD